MRALSCAVALVIVVGASLPSGVSARAPEARRAWGCYFSAGTPGIFTHANEAGPGGPWWSAAARAGGCDRTRVLIVTTKLWQVPDGGPRILIGKATEEIHLTPRVGPPWRARDGHPLRRWHPEIFPSLGPTSQRACPGYEPPVPGAKSYLTMSVKRKSHRGRIWVASRPVADPCDAARYRPRSL